MNILIIGGTRFVGRALVQNALANGHKLTLFNRGQSNPGLFPEVEELKGDRGGDLSELKGRRWDAVIDTCGYRPQHVRASAGLLKDAAERYIFISSVSVYADTSKIGVDESGKLEYVDTEDVENVTGPAYGGLKVRCEQAAEAAFPGRTLIIRPGLIVGPHDPTDRFTYWPERVAEGGDVLAPGRPERVVQFIDVRDLAEWTMRMVEQRATGIYSADGPAQPIEMGRLLEICRQVSHSSARFFWVAEEFLLNKNVEPWKELPLWMPESDPAMAGFFQFNVEKAKAAGLTYRPTEETVRATLEWNATRPAGRERKAGMDRNKEASLLETWQKFSV